MPKPKVRFAPLPQGRRESVHALIQACTEDRRRRSVAEVLEAKKRRLSAIPEQEGPDRRESNVSNAEEAQLVRPERRSSVQGFIDKTGIIAHSVHQLDAKIAELAVIYQGAPTDDDEAYVEYVVTKKTEHHAVVQEMEDLCRVIRHQIQSIKMDIQSAGKRGILSMDPTVRRMQYSDFVASLSRMMSNYLDSELQFLHWEKTLENVQASRRTSVISIHATNSHHADNLEQMESELTEIKNLSVILHDVRRMFEDLASLVEGQADLLDRIDELDKGTATDPVTPVLTSDELEDKLLEEERMQRRMDIKSLLFFGMVGFVIFLILTAVVLSRGRVCYGGANATSPYTCNNHEDDVAPTTQTTVRTASLKQAH